MRGGGCIKTPMLAKFANISYHDLLRKVLNQAEAVIKNRMEVVPPKTPFYDDGWIHTPRGSRLKDSPEKIDMRGAQELIETSKKDVTTN